MGVFPLLAMSNLSWNIMLPKRARRRSLLSVPDQDAGAGAGRPAARAHGAGHRARHELPALLPPAHRAQARLHPAHAASLPLQAALSS